MGGLSVVQADEGAAAVRHQHIALLLLPRRAEIGQQGQGEQVGGGGTLDILRHHPGHKAVLVQGVLHRHPEGDGGLRSGHLILGVVLLQLLLGIAAGNDNRLQAGGGKIRQAVHQDIDVVVLNAGILGDKLLPNHLGGGGGQGVGGIKAAHRGSIRLGQAGQQHLLEARFGDNRGHGIHLFPLADVIYHPHAALAGLPDELPELHRVGVAVHRAYLAFAVGVTQLDLRKERLTTLPLLRGRIPAAIAGLFPHAQFGGFSVDKQFQRVRLRHAREAILCLQPRTVGRVGKRLLRRGRGRRRLIGPASGKTRRHQQRAEQAA